MTATRPAGPARGTRARRPSTIARYLWLIIVFLDHLDPPAGAAGRADAANCPIRIHVVLSRTLQIVVIPAVLAADTTNGLLATAWRAAYRAIRDLTREPLTGRAAAIPGTSMTRPVPPSGADTPDHRSPNPAQRNQIRVHDQHEHPTGTRTHETKIKKAGES